MSIPDDPFDKDNDLVPTEEDIDLRVELEEIIQRSPIIPLNSPPKDEGPPQDIDEDISGAIN